MVRRWGQDCTSHVVEAEAVKLSPVHLESTATSPGLAKAKDVPLVFPCPVDSVHDSEVSKPLDPQALSSHISAKSVVSPLPARVPAVYAELNEVFNKQKASILPPHRPYDCAINPLPGTSPPRGRLYSLSGPETAAMESYIDEALAAGVICPSTSPAGAGLFFVGKKEGGAQTLH